MSGDPFDFGPPKKGEVRHDKPWKSSKEARDADEDEHEDEAKPQEPSTGANVAGALAFAVSAAVVSGVLKSPEGAYLAAALIGGAIAGAVCGLFPLLAGWLLGRTALGQWGMGVCVFAGMVLGVLAAVPVAVMFALIIALVGRAPDEPEERDRPRRRRVAAKPRDEIPEAELVEDDVETRRHTSRGPVWRVAGIDAASGQKVSREIVADSETEAAAAVMLEGLEVQSVERLS